MADRACSDCGNPITRQAKTGRCRVCSLARSNADPLLRQRQRDAIRLHAAQPAVKAARIARLRAHATNMSPEERARRQGRGRHIAATVLQTPEVRARSNSPQAKAKAGAARTDTTLAWCPPAYRDRYRFLKTTKRLSAAEARAATEEEIAADQRRMTPFERQLARIALGAALVVKPDFRTSGPAFTLGGIASAAL